MALNMKVKMLLGYVFIPLIFYGFDWILFFLYRLVDFYKLTIFQNVLIATGMIYSVIGMLIVMPVLMIKKGISNLNYLKWDSLQFFIYFIIFLIALIPIILSAGMAIGGG